MQSRQSPISSRKRSTTIALSEGRTPVACSCSRRKTSRFSAARSSRSCSVVRRSRARSSSSADELPAGAADRLAELVRAADALALPERHQARDAGSGRDEHAVAGDLLDPPRRGAEEERLAGAGLVDHLLVELADAAAALHQVHAEEAAVRDRPGVGDREPARALASAQEPGDAVPGDARPQLGELLGRVPAGEHVEHVLQLLARQVVEGPGAADEIVELVDGDLLLCADGDDLLGEDVQRVARDARLLDQPFLHAPDHDRRLEEVGPELREDAALGGLVEAMAGAADPLEPAGDGLRRLHLDDEVDGAHVDPELQRGGGDETRDVAALQQLFDLDPLLARERAVVSARDLVLGQLVQAQREALGETAVVDEDDRGAVLAHELEERRVDRRPDRVALARLAHVLERNDDAEVELLARAGVDELDRPAAGDEAADLLERALGGGEADALDRLVHEPLEPLEAERQVRASLRAGDGMHLVDDDDADVAEVVAGAGREQQEERLGGRDEDVRRALEHRRPLLRRCVPGADGHGEPRADPRQRPTEVPLDVVVQRLERADVEHLGALTGLGAVERPEERRERLAGAGRRLDEDVAAGGDGRPALLLRRRRAGEGPLEPAAHVRAEGRERAHPSSVPRRRGAAAAACAASLVTTGHPNPPPAFEPNVEKRTRGARIVPRESRAVPKPCRPAPAQRPQLESRHGRDPPDAPLLHGRRRGRPLPGRGAAGAAGRLRARPAGDRPEGLRRAARDPAPARDVRRRDHRRDRPGRAGGALPAEARHPPLPREHGRARAGALRGGRGGLRGPGRARVGGRRERRGPRAPPPGPPRNRPDEGAIAVGHPRQALRRPAARLGGRRPHASDARRRRFLRGARGLPGEEARPQGGHARRRKPPASRRRRGARPAPRAPSRERSRDAGSPACPRRSA